RYSEARTDQDVFAADKDAIHDFVGDWAERGSFHSLVGAAGLGVKNLVEEKVLGRSLYGRGGAMSGRKRGHGECSGSAPEFKKLYGSGVANYINEALYSGERARADSSTGNEEEEQSQALRNEGGAGIGSNAENDGVVVQQILRIPRDQGMVRVHRDSKLLTTWGYVTVLTEITYAHNYKYKGYQTSMSRLPVEYIYLYMTPAHFNMLSDNTKAIRCSAKITPHGIRTPWKTGSSVVQPVNSDMMVYGVSAVGLNLSLDTGMCVPGPGTADNAMYTTNPTEFKEADHRKLIEKYWGMTMDEHLTMTKSDTIPTCMGVPRHNKCYFIHCANFSPRTNKFVNVYPFKSHIGTPIVNYEYEFKNAWIKTCHPYCGNSRTYVAAPSDSLTKMVSSLDNDSSSPDGVVKPTKLSPNTEVTRYTNPIEREWGRQGLGTHPNLHAAQPSVGFGIMAVSKKNLDTPGSGDKFQEVAAFFQVDTEIVLHTDVDTINPMQTCYPAQEQHFEKNSFGMYIPHNRQTHLGQYTYIPKTSSRVVSVPFSP
ncbi:unnamed protein product, partial [Ixodes hexagonus]